MRALPAAIGRSERVIEGVFNLRARVEGNDVGYEHDRGQRPARDDPALDAQRRRRARAATCLLLDAGVEGHDLYTADVTRTMPINGTFSRPPSGAIYELVYEAQRRASPPCARAPSSWTRTTRP